jgi:cytochrome bd-type quinol oxidase subunit 2
MSFCSYCGSQVADGTLFCPNCGANLNKSASSDASYTGGYFHTAPKRNYSESALIAAVAFLFPIVGLICWAAMKESDPGKATSALKGLWATLCYGIPIVGVILWAVWKDTEPGKATSALKGLWAYLCFNVPIVGVIMFFVWRYSKPDYAKVGLVSGIIGFVLNFLFVIVYAIGSVAFYEGLYGTMSVFAPVFF